MGQKGQRCKKGVTRSVRSVKWMLTVVLFFDGGGGGSVAGGGWEGLKEKNKRTLF